MDYTLINAALEDMASRAGEQGTVTGCVMDATGAGLATIVLGTTKRRESFKVSLANDTITFMGLTARYSA